MIIALVAFIVSHFTVDFPVDDYMVHIIYILCVFPLAARGETYVRLSALFFILFQYRVSIDYLSNPITETFLFSYYEYIAFALHLLIILSLVHRGLINGVCNTRIDDITCWLSHNKSNFTHQKTNTGR